MKSKFFYRIPGRETVENHGFLSRIDTLDTIDGCVVSNFLGTEFYGFSENELSIKVLSLEHPFCISKEEYLIQARHFIERLTSKNIDKAILSRIKKVENVSLKPFELFQKLCFSYPNAFCYFLESDVLGTWVGASPEQLIQSTEIGAATMALAGTKQSSDTTSWGEKELHEQNFVKQYIEETLKEFAIIDQVSAQEELIAGPVKHLVNYFSFRPLNNSYSTLIQNLHPTPAVSGFPKMEALELIESMEKHQRSIYAGIIGVKNRTSMNLFVNLRCCQFIENTMYLYVGGGFTQNSIPENEWQETENKAKTLLNLLE